MYTEDTSLSLLSKIMCIIYKIILHIVYAHTYVVKAYINKTKVKIMFIF